MIKTNPPILLVGSGRSGTTWLHDLLTMDFDYRAIFEPLHELQAPGSNNNYANKYLDRHDTVPDLEEYLFKVFYYKTDDAWLRWLHFGISSETSIFRKTLQYGYNLPKFKFWAKNRVVKFIKANLMVDWLSNKFETQKIIYLIRHPCAVVSSQRKLGWNTNLSGYLSQPKLMNLYYDNYNLIKSASGVIEKLTIQWCIENSLLLWQIKNHNIDILFLRYEDIVLNPLTTLTYIMEKSSYHKPKIKKIAKKMIKTKSPKTSSLYKWQGELEVAEKEYIIKTAKKFGILLYDLQ